MSINWKGCGGFLLIGFCVAILGWTAHSSVKQQDEYEARVTAHRYSTDRNHCRTYTTLTDFEYHPGLRKSATLTMENGEKFLYHCGDRLIDICNNLEVGTRACYDFPYVSEVVQGWNENLK